jgi:two-component system CheB/CheR fusion protein
MQAKHLAKMGAVVENLTDAIVVHDMEGRIIAWNPGAESLYGWSEAEALEMNIRELIPVPDREAALELVRRLSQSEILESYRTRRIGKNGEQLEVVLTATILTNSGGDAYAVATLERRVKRTTDG